VENPGGMAVEFGDLGHGRVAPEGDLVLRKAVRAHDLLVVLAPDQRAHLATGINGVDKIATVRVVEADVSVCCTTARRQQVFLPGAPC